MRLEAAFKGNLKEYMKAEFATAERAVTLGVSETTDGLKMAMRRQVTNAGLGQRMANTWRGDVYPKGKNSIRAAGVVYTRASRIMEGFERAAVIRSKDGWWLAIPTPNAPKRGVGGKRINPSNFPEHRYGRLRFVYRRNGPSLLVVENARASYNRKTGELHGFRKASEKAVNTGRGLTTVVMFWLVPQVQLKRLITFDAEARRWFDRLPKLILKNWPD
ncbi:MAG: DUF6441 family protein [Alphaproteobacteria bacterium]|nr:DUF6441 family protein [Alphaproteobacteria bacterium]